MKLKTLIFLCLSIFYGTILADKDEQKTLVVDPLYEAYSGTNFVLRWHYQYFCDHVYDPRTDIWRWPTDEDRGVTFDPRKVKAGDTIFIRMFDKFFSEMHPRIKVPYIVVSAGECLDKMTPKYKKHLDQKNVIAWFGVHPDPMAMNHPKFQPLPLGVLQNPDHYEERVKLNNYFKQLRTVSKKHWVYLNFAFAEKPEREVLYNLMVNKPFCKKGKRQDFKDYLHQMAQCKFTLSPEGLGPDCYRTWEAFLVGTIPIVRRSCLDPLYEGLPVLIVDNWEDIDEPLLKKSYEEICSKKYDMRRLYTEYWTDKIKAVQKNFLRKWNRETYE